MIGNYVIFFLFRNINNTKRHIYAENKLHLFNPKIIILIINIIIMKIIILIINFVIYTILQFYPRIDRIYNR